MGHTLLQWLLAVPIALLTRCLGLRGVPCLIPIGLVKILRIESAHSSPYRLETVSTCSLPGVWVSCRILRYISLSNPPCLSTPAYFCKTPRLRNPRSQIICTACHPAKPSNKHLMNTDLGLVSQRVPIGMSIQYKPYSTPGTWCLQRQSLQAGQHPRCD